MVRDYQEIRIQEPVGGHAGGSARAAPRALLVVLDDDLVDKVQAGDDVQMAVVVRRRWYKCAKEQRCEVELVGHCVSLCVAQKQKRVENTSNLEDKTQFTEFWRENEASPFRARDMILRAMCPQLYGMAVPKLALMLALIGGVARRDSTGGRVRGESHILLVGDPGMGKSQLLKYAAEVAPRAVLTTGMGSSAAGLTVAATKESGEWALEAGALVLADGGVCCIDEFDSIREAERATIHEAMEQQTLSVAKAGMVTTLRTRTTVIGATNPKGGQFDVSSSLSVNTGLAPPLLSRFDCLIVLRDDRKASWDRAVSAHILETHARLGALDANDESATQSQTIRGSLSSLSNPGSSQLSDGARWGRALARWTAEPEAAVDKAAAPEKETYVSSTDSQRALQEESEAMWPFERLRRYIAHVKATFQPHLTEDAERLLTAYYQAQRRLEGRSVARTTIRMLESLIRLTQAHARLMFREVAGTTGRHDRDMPRRGVHVVPHAVHRVAADERRLC
jgi:DNA helicase MCM9